MTGPAADPFDLERFVLAQEGTYDVALAELRRGRKTGHWIWFVFPQLRGLGVSRMSHRYGITGLDEARAYLAHPLLGPRLVASFEALLAHAGTRAIDILGDVDAMKVRSSVTLFARADPARSAFRDVLDAFYGGHADARTDELLGVDRA
jgi:uncharacterized protein (DUF1810 family)